MVFFYNTLNKISKKIIKMLFLIKKVSKNSITSFMGFEKLDNKDLAGLRHMASLKACAIKNKDVLLIQIVALYQDRSLF